jgi:Fe2+ or Zn2+ uptake regulation protein
MSQAEKKFEEYLSRNGLRMTEQRRAIFEAFSRSDRHLSAEEIYDLVRGSRSGVGIATIWRNMKLMRQAGIAEEHHFLDGRVRYEKKCTMDHGHMICIVCGRPVEFGAGKIISELRHVANINSFEVTDFKVSIFGTCFLCKSAQRSGDRVKGRME